MPDVSDRLGEAERKAEFLMSYPALAFAFLFCAAATMVLCLYARPICAALGLIDEPGSRKKHANATPLAGGVVLQFVVAPILLFLALVLSPVLWAAKLLIIVAATMAMTLVGLADDRHTLSAHDRLLVSFLVFGSASIIDPLFNVRVLIFDYPSFQLGLGNAWLAVVFTTICCVGLVNAINMADGKNGLVIGLCLGWLGLLWLRAPLPLVPAIVVIIAALLVLLVFNLRGRLFLGDGGAYGLATAIGLIAIAIYNSPGGHGGRAVSANELVLLFAIPVLDSFRLTFARLRRGQSPMAGDHDHLHHHLHTWFGWPLGLFVYWVLSLLPSMRFFLSG